MAELDYILAENDFTLDIDYSGAFGRDPSRVEINDMVAEVTSGEILDGKLKNNRKLLVFDIDGKCWLMFYLANRDKWLFEKLGIR